MELKQLYTDLILEYNKDKTNKRKIENPTVHEHGHNPSCGDDIDIEVKIEDGVIKDVTLYTAGAGYTVGLEELEAAITLKDISKMPVRVKCATLGWHTLEMALTRIEKQLSEQK